MNRNQKKVQLNNISYLKIKRIRKLIMLLTLFMVVTIFMYMTSPIEWPTYKPLRLYLLVGSYIIAFLIGGRTASARLYRSSKYTCSYYPSPKDKILRYLRFTIPITLIFTLIYLAYNLSVVGISGSMFNQIYSAITDMSIGYYEKTQNTTPKILNWLTVLGGPIFVSTSFWGFLYYKELHKKYKLLFFIFATAEITRWLIIGTGKGAIGILVTWAITLLLKRYIGLDVGEHDGNINYKERKKKERISWRRIVVVFLIAITVFGFVGISRSGYNISASYDGIVNTEHLLFKIFPLELAYIGCRIYSYLCQGYYGLSLTAHLTWECTYGFGNSGFMRQRLTNILGYDAIWSKTYQHRMHVYGWHETSNWHTMYVWFANDIGLIGVIVLMFFFGTILVKSLYDGFYKGNINAMMVSFLIINVILYSSMNNQVFLSPDTLVSFVVFYVLWINSRLKKSAS